jgi:hypothetical protein
MPIPGIVGSAVKAGLAIGPNVWAVSSAIGGIQEKRRAGQGTSLAVGSEIASLAYSFLDPVGYFAVSLGVPAVRAATAGVVEQVRSWNSFVRSAKTPFSHRFEHTDVTARAQMMGLQAIGSAWGNARMGSEAANFARRYSRG